MTTRLAARFALGILAGAAAACGGGDHPPAAPTPPQVPLPAPPPQPAQTFTVSGVVTNYTARPLPGVRVALTDTSDGRGTTTDGMGRYAFDKTSGAIQITASLEGFHDDHRRLSLTRDLVVDLELTPPITLDAGRQVSAELHGGPQSDACAAFLITVVDPCRPVTVRVARSGTLRATLEWHGAPGVALTQVVNVAPGIALPKYGPSVCCTSGLVLRVPVTEGSRVALLVRLRDARISPVHFTLRTSVE